MENKNQKRRFKKILSRTLIVITCVLCLYGCNTNSNEPAIKRDPQNPVTISVWHYYNGSIMNAFEESIKEFNETVGAEQGIIVESYGHGSVIELEKAVMASANKEIGSPEMPEIFASYADTAYMAEKMGLLANLDDYFTKEEQEEYLDSYIEEGKIGQNGELRIFPVAKSTEIFMLNDTDWIPFAEANGLTYEDLATVEDITRVAELYYNWTDSLTPDVQNDGKSFFGRDSMANFIIIAFKEFDTELFNVNDGVATIEIKTDVMKKVWDNYYIPYISGYFSAYGRYRSDDTKVGDILAYAGATSSAGYFPSEVTTGNKSYPIQAKVLPAPHFKDANKVMVQQGAGMVVVQSTPEAESASVEFLKWFTQSQKNIEFAALSGYMPVKKEAVDYNTFKSQIDESGIVLDEVMDETIKIAFEEIKASELYTNKAFDGGAKARAILENHLQDKAVADREAVLQLISSGSTYEQAIAQFATEDNFKSWLKDITLQLNEAAK